MSNVILYSMSNVINYSLSNVINYSLSNIIKYSLLSTCLTNRIRYSFSNVERELAALKIQRVQRGNTGRAKVKRLQEALRFVGTVAIPRMPSGWTKTAQTSQCKR